MKLHVLHVITGLPIGGAQSALHRLLSRLPPDDFRSAVVSLRNVGPMDAKIRELGVPVDTLNMGGGVADLARVAGLAWRMRAERPDVVQTWLYHADFFGGIAARLAGKIPVVWGIRQGDLDPVGLKSSTRSIAKGSAWLSRRLPARIVCCSEASRRTHASFGYAPENMVVIPNGFDLDTFRPDPAARESVREALELPSGARLVGLIGRFDPQKDHRSFVAAAALLHAHLPDVHFVLCGADVSWQNPELARWIENSGICGSVHLLGPREDVPRISAALDVCCSASAYGEGFPNVIGEAMACAVPCVVTDVGDSAEIVGETGRVVPPRNPQALASALSALLEAPATARQRLGEHARERIAGRYGLSSIASRYADLYQEVAADVRH